MNNSAIGVFDSGMGGLSVWREMKRMLPHESLTFFADGKNCPYGDRSPQELTAFIVEAVDELMNSGVKMIVLACNTATAVAVDYLRKHYDIPFVGMEPAVKPAVMSSRTGVVGILATKAAFGGRLFIDTSRRCSSKARIVSRVGEGFVEIVESGSEESPEAFETVRKALEPLIEQGADRIVLGCTHYPFLRRQMERVIGDRDVELIDPSEAIVRRVEYLLDKFDMRAEQTNVPRYDFMSFAGDEYMKRLIDKSRAAEKMCMADNKTR